MEHSYRCSIKGKQILKNSCYDKGNIVINVQLKESRY